MAQDPAILDRCLKVLTRRAYPAMFRLFGAVVDPAQVRFEDVALNLPEHRADDLMVVESPHPEERWALLLRIRFGNLTPDTEARIAKLIAVQALDLLERVEKSSSLAELSF